MNENTRGMISVPRRGNFVPPDAWRHNFGPLAFFPKIYDHMINSFRTNKFDQDKTLEIFVQFGEL